MFFADVAYAMGAQGGAGAEAGNPLMSMMPLVLMFVIFYFLLIRPQQKKAKAHREMLGALKKGDKVLTGGGMYGRIEGIDGDVISVDLGNGLIVEVNRSFVSGLAERAPKSAKPGKGDK
ncbi:MAG: preprotein translocase subunit YajC [Proteobacteria bacterium]|nr:preprotein translocase subunit YajC [Pseudomonadota bacterium]